MPWAVSLVSTAAATAAGDGDDDHYECRLPPHVHDIVKHREHGGECRKCGRVGSWAFIKSIPCTGPRSAPDSTVNPKDGLVAPPLPESTEGLEKELDLALQNGDDKAALEIVGQIEAADAQQSLQDQELAIEIMELELQLLDATEELETLERLEAQEAELEEEEAELQKALLLSKQPLDARPPATPCASLTEPPVVATTKSPAVCSSARYLSNAAQLDS